MDIELSDQTRQRGLVVSTITEEVIDLQAAEEEQDALQVAEAGGPRVVSASALAGASPAVPRDSRLLDAERAEHEARTAAQEAAAAKAAAEDAAIRAAEARNAAERTKAELEAARAEAKAKAEAAALQVVLDQEELDQKAAALRAENRARRDEQLGTVRVPAPDPQIVTVTRNSTDAPLGALALFLVRLVLAGWTGVVGWQALIDRQAVLDAMVKVGLPKDLSLTLVWGVGAGLITIAVFLLFGVATRFFAIVMLAGVAGFLAYFRFGPFNPLIEGYFGFYGDRELFVAVLCLLLVLLGAGGFSLDARIRRRRQAAKQAA